MAARRRPFHTIADQVASRVNDEMQAILLSRRKNGVPGGLGDSRAIRAAIYENLLRQMTPKAPAPHDETLAH